MFRDYNELLINAGNILHIHHIKSKTGITSSEELVDCLKTAIKNGQRIGDEKMIEVYNITEGPELAEGHELLTNVKVFLKNPSCENLEAAVNTVKITLHDLVIDSLIIWYPNHLEDEPSEELLNLWNVMGTFVTEKKVNRLGIADIDTNVFISLYEQATIKPGIFHINVQNCCLVPPDLQAFAEEREIQLLTHYDPPDILPGAALPVEIKEFNTHWVARYQSHVRCRGVLAKKGYLAYFRQV